MAEVYTCVCGGQRWTICGAKIECDKCGREYILMWDVGIDGQMESPKEFNERVKQDEHGGLISEPEPPFTKKLIDDKEG